MKTTTELLPDYKQYVAHNNKRLVLLSNVTSALGDYISGDVWERTGAGPCGMSHGAERNFYGNDAPEKALAWLAQQIDVQPELLTYRCPANVANDLRWTATRYWSRP